MKTRLSEIKKAIWDTAIQEGRDPSSIALLAVTKNQPIARILALLEEGHRLFGENRLQEAHAKWPQLMREYPHVDLHLIGHLQTNKVKEAVALFDVIETLDSLRLAEKLVKEQEKQKKYLAYYIEINIGKELQKTGIWPQNFEAFYRELKDSFQLNINGIMCIPPYHKDPTLYFKEMNKLAKEFEFPVISMGMSEDYKLAIKYNSNLVRIGRALYEN